MAKNKICDIQMLDNDIQTGKKADWNDCLEHNTQMEADIIRLRRELNKLRKMLDPWTE